MHAEAILGIAALSLVLTVFYGPWQETWTDWARQVVFECRDKIFDMAADGEIAFKSNEYRDIRESLHKLIRYSPHATFTSIFVRFIDENYGKKNVLGVESALKASIKRISSTDARSKINTLVSKAQGAVIVSVLAKSLPGLFVIVAAWIATKLHLNKRQYAKLISDMIQRDSEISVY